MTDPAAFFVGCVALYASLHVLRGRLAGRVPAGWSVALDQCPSTVHAGLTTLCTLVTLCDAQHMLAHVIAYMLVDGFVIANRLVDAPTSDDRVLLVHHALSAWCCVVPLIFRELGLLERTSAVLSIEWPVLALNLSASMGGSPAVQLLGVLLFVVTRLIGLPRETLAVARRVPWHAWAPQIGALFPYWAMCALQYYLAGDYAVKWFMVKQKKKPRARVKPWANGGRRTA